MSRIERAGLVLLATLSGAVAASAYPTITITEPAKGARVAGLVQIAAVPVPDGDPVERVDFYVLTSYLSPVPRVCTDATPPYECTWNSNSVDNGRAVLLAEAIIGGVSRAVAEVDVMVGNPVVGDLRLTTPNPMQSYERPRLWGPSLAYHDKYSFMEPYTGGNIHQDLGTLVDRDIGFGGYEAHSVLNTLVPFGVHAVFSEEYPQFDFRALSLYNTATFDLEYLVFDSHVEVGNLDFFGERIVWSDQLAGSSLLNRNIHALHLVTREQLDLGFGFSPAIWGNTAVWMTYDDAGQKFIQSYDFSTNQFQRLASVDGGDDVLAVSGQWVVWTGSLPGSDDPTVPPGRQGLHLLNRATGVRTTIGQPNRQRSPAMWGGKVVWTERRFGNQDVYLYDLATGQEQRVTDHPAVQSSPDIFGDVVVWHDDRFGDATRQVLTVYTRDLANRLAEPRPLGYMEGLDAAPLRARGWAVNPASPEDVVRVYVFDGPPANGHFLGMAMADRPRPDVNRMTGYPGDHGFEFTLPPSVLDGQEHSLYVTIGEDLPGLSSAPLLDGSPWVFRFLPVIGPDDPGDTGGEK